MVIRSNSDVCKEVGMTEDRTQLLLAVEQSHPRLGIGRSKFLELLRLGEVESVKIGNRRLVVASSLADYVERLRAGSSTEAWG